jgi:uncharacterized protein HemX
MEPMSQPTQPPSPTDRLLKMLVGLTAALVLIALAFGVAGAVMLGSLKERQERIEERMASGARLATDQARSFRTRRERLEPIASGPINKLEQQIRLMQLMVDEQLALLQQAGGIRADVANSGDAPRARSPEKVRR